MKRFVALFLAVILLPCCASATGEEFNAEGEWFCAILYENMCALATIDAEGNYHISDSYGEQIFRINGEIEDPYESIKAVRIQLADDSCLYYTVQDHELQGCLFLNVDDSWRCYSVESQDMVLFSNGSITHFNEGETVDYLISGENMYMKNSDTYLRGTIRQFDHSVFAFDMDTDPYTVTFGDKTVDYGTPFYLFISTSIGKK